MVKTEVSLSEDGSETMVAEVCGEKGSIDVIKNDKGDRDQLDDVIKAITNNEGELVTIF